jgi:hypothetical protein
MDKCRHKSAGKSERYNAQVWSATNGSGCPLQDGFMPLFSSYLSGSYVFITGRRTVTGTPGKKLPADYAVCTEYLSHSFALCIAELPAAVLSFLCFRHSEYIFNASLFISSIVLFFLSSCSSCLISCNAHKILSSFSA